MNQQYMSRSSSPPTDTLQQMTIANEADIIYARKQVRTLCQELGFNLTETTRIVTSASELSRNIQRYAGQGVMQWRISGSEPYNFLELNFIDQGPGIENIEQAMTPGYSSIRSLGMGLPGAKRLMDQIEITSSPGQGTTVSIRKRLPRLASK